MRTVRLYVDQHLATGKRLALPSERSRYLTQSLRLGTGAEIRLFNENDGEFVARVDQPQKNQTLVTISDPIPTDTESRLSITLAQAIGRGDRMDYAVQKATELGVTAIQPLLSDRTEVKLKAERRENRRQRWLQVGRAACEQSGRTKPPVIYEPATTQVWLTQLQPTDRYLILEPTAQTKLQNGNAQSVTVATGPEGGWSPAELDAFGKKNFEQVRLGPRILRTETAGAVVVALLQAQMGDLLK